MGPVPYPPHPDTEYEGHAPPDAASTEIAVRNAITTISEIMAEDRRRRGSDALPDLAPPVAMETVAPRKGRKRRAQARNPKQGAGALARIRAFRPKTQHLGWALAFAAVLLWPRVVLIAAFALFCLTLIGGALFGTERFTSLRERLQGFGDLGLSFAGVARLRGMLAGWRRHKEAPDPFADHPDPFERIAKESH
ncbi:hypothetical protein [Roseovarius sp. MBR-154]